MSYNITPKENERRLTRLRLELEKKGDGKCYFPCTRWKALSTRILLISTTKKHCREHGNAKVGYEYHPLVSYSFNVFVLILFVKLSIVLIFVIYTNFTWLFVRQGPLGVFCYRNSIVQVVEHGIFMINILYIN